MSNAFEVQRMQELRKFYLDRNDPISARLVDKIFKMMPFEELKVTLLKKHGEIPKNWQNNDRYAKYKELLRKGYSRNKVKAIMEEDGLDPGELMWEKRATKPSFSALESGGNQNQNKVGESLEKLRLSLSSANTANASNRGQEGMEDSTLQSLPSKDSKGSGSAQSRATMFDLSKFSLASGMKNNGTGGAKLQRKRSKNVMIQPKRGTINEKGGVRKLSSDLQVAAELSMDAFHDRKVARHRKTHAAGKILNSSQNASSMSVSSASTIEAHKARGRRRKESKESTKNSTMNFPPTLKQTFSLGDFQDFLDKHEIDESFGALDEQNGDYKEYAHIKRFGENAKVDPDIVIDPSRESQFLFSLDDLDAEMGKIGENNDDDKDSDASSDIFDGLHNGNSDSKESKRKKTAPDKEVADNMKHLAKMSEAHKVGGKLSINNISDNSNTVGVLHDLQPYFRNRRNTISETRVTNIAKRVKNQSEKTLPSSEADNKPPAAVTQGLTPLSANSSSTKVTHFPAALPRKASVQNASETANKPLEDFVELDLNFSNTTKNYRVLNPNKKYRKISGVNENDFGDDEVPTPPVAPPRVKRRPKANSGPPNTPLGHRVDI